MSTITEDTDLVLIACQGDARGPEALRLLQAAEALGLEAAVVVSSDRGFYVPEAVAFYEEPEPEVEPEATPTAPPPRPAKK